MDDFTEILTLEGLVKLITFGVGIGYAGAHIAGLVSWAITAVVRLLHNVMKAR